MKFAVKTNYGGMVDVEEVEADTVSRDMGTLSFFMGNREVAAFAEGFWLAFREITEGTTEPEADLSSLPRAS